MNKAYRFSITGKNGFRLMTNHKSQAGLFAMLGMNVFDFVNKKYI